MTNLSDNREQAALEQRLRAVRAELSESIEKVKSRRRTTVLGLLLAIVVMIGYLTWIFDRVIKIDAEFVADLAYGQVHSYVDQSPEILGKELRDRAPSLFDRAERIALEGPATASTYARKAMLAKTTEILDQAEPQIDQAVDDAIASIKGKAATNNVDLKNPAQVDQLADQLVMQLNGDVSKTIEHVYSDYSQQADEMLRHLDELAVGKNLDPLQQRQRAVLISFMALTQKWKTNPPPLGVPDISAPGGSEDVPPTTSPAPAQGAGGS